MGGTRHDDPGKRRPDKDRPPTDGIELRVVDGPAGEAIHPEAAQPISVEALRIGTGLPTGRITDQPFAQAFEDSSAAPDVPYRGSRRRRVKPRQPEREKTPEEIGRDRWRRRRLFAGFLATMSVVLWTTLKPVWDSVTVVPPPEPNANLLALGKDSPVKSSEVIALNAPVELDGLSRGRIASMRRSFVDRHPELLKKPYEPYPPIWREIVEGLPWWGIKGFYYYNGIAPGKRADGPSLEGQYVANPYLLVGAHWNDVPRWSDSFDPEQHPEAQFGCAPRDLVWRPGERLVEVTYPLSEYRRQLCTLNGWPSADKLLPTFFVQDINARDFGFNYKRVVVDDVAKPYPHGYAPVRTGQFFHEGRSMEVPCNNLGTVVPSDWRFVPNKIGSNVRVLLWREKPASDETPPDMTCVLHFK